MIEGKILVTGGSGFLGSKVVDKLVMGGKDKKDIHSCNSKCHDLRYRSNIADLMSNRYDLIIHCAGNVGGIGYNQQLPADLFYENLSMGIDLLHSAAMAKVKKFVSVGTICAYPKNTPVPFREEDIWDGYPEETNAPYGLAKKMLLVQGQAYRKQYGFNSIYLIPVNMYGPGDHFAPERSHVIPALIKKIYDAKESNKNEITIWGTGTATREFLYVEDAADAIIKATEIYDKPEPVNIGTGQEISILELTRKISNLMGWEGRIKFDASKPDGQPKRCLDVSRAKTEFGWEAHTPFDIGLRAEIDDYKRRYHDI
jgi:GDP-L-fucose synthase